MLNRRYISWNDEYIVYLEVGGSFLWLSPILCMHIMHYKGAKISTKHGLIVSIDVNHVCIKCMI